MIFSKLKTIWTKFKWYILAGLALVVLLILVFARRPPVLTKLLKGMIKAQRNLVKAELERKRKSVEDNESEVAKVDKRIEEIDNEIERIDQDVDEMSLEELSNAWKSMGL